MKCSQDGKTATRRARPGCPKRAVEAEGGDSSVQERLGGEEPTLFAEMTIRIVPIPDEDA